MTTTGKSSSATAGAPSSGSGQQRSRKKTREEVLADFENDLVRFEAMSIKIAGFDEPLEFSRTMDPMPQRLHFIIPEYSIYNLTVRYKVKQRPLRVLTYHQTVKRKGIPVDDRNLHMIEDAWVNKHGDDGDYHEVTFPPSGVPGGSFLRGDYKAKSVVKEEGRMIWSYKWTLEVVKKGVKPSIGGFDDDLDEGEGEDEDVAMSK
ncbi:Rho GDP-dissociation inhibitor [Candida viswanathii]|uniref:Rho GDP-dissociation inhibitor n=1 Tax=Candida viswanathii TaxID=5486 RepID=A0A367Y493_9ASCO|nr:Rho GDP-dissociation inhibitor [Candida viswanathii]